MPVDTPSQSRRRGEAARDAGMALAAHGKAWLIYRDTLRFLDAIMSLPNLIASMDDVAGDPNGKFHDGGKWRGSIPKALAADGLIEQVDVVKSDRPSRHRGYIARWRAVDLAGIEVKRDELRQWLDEHPCPAEPIAETLFDDLSGKGMVRDAR